MTKNKTNLVIIDKCKPYKNGKPLELRGTAAQLVVSKDFGREKLEELEKEATTKNCRYVKKPIFIDIITGKTLGFFYEEI